MDARLKSFADRLDRLEDERLAVVHDAKEVYGEAKSAGYNPKALRKVLADRRRKTDEALQADIEFYRSLLGEPGSTYRSVADRIGVSKSKLQRLVPKNERGTAGQPAHDPDTGEIAETADAGPPGDDTGTAVPSSPAPVVATPCREMTEDDLGDPLLVIDRDRARFREKVRRVAASVKPQEAHGPTISDDDAWAAADAAGAEFLAAKRARGLAA